MRKVILLLAWASSLQAAELLVGPGHPHATLTSALAAASAGDVIKVHAGHYREGNLRVEKPLILEGIGFPVLDGENKHEILTVTASDVTIRGFEPRHSGVSSLEDRAGIRIEGADRVTVEGNRLRDCHFGIYLAKAKACRVLGNDVRGTPGREHDTGNGIHLWHCAQATVSGNLAHGQRDGIYLEFASETIVEDNDVADNLRYGLHFMFSHGSKYQRNSFQRNGAGVAVMYSRQVEMTRNYFGSNWGASAYGLLLKDMTDGRISGNCFERNTTGITMDGSNRMTVEANEFRENGRALQIHSNSSSNTITRNNFSGNSFDIAAAGELDDTRLAANYWDKYEGYDLRRDGAGDVPHRPVSLYAVMVNRVPPSVLLLRSPIVHVLDQAEKAFPSLTPETVKDDSPAMRPHDLSAFRPARDEKKP